MYIWGDGSRLASLTRVKPKSVIRAKSATGNEIDYFLSSFIFLLAFCFLFVLDVARYAIEQTENKLLNNQIKSVQDLMTASG